jgi:hypothetical protein
LPAIGERGFDATGRQFRMAVRLEPDHEYEFTLNRHSGGGFASAAGVPLARYLIRFRTRPAGP